MYGSISCGKISRYFIKELPAGLGLCSANSILSASLDSHSTSITNLSASLGLRTANFSLPAGLGLRIANFPLPAGLDLHSARTINLPAGLGLRSANSSNLPAGLGLRSESWNSNKTFQLVVKFSRPPKAAFNIDIFFKLNDVFNSRWLIVLTLDSEGVKKVSMSNFYKKSLQNKLFMLIDKLNCKWLIVILGLQENQSVFQQDLVDSLSSNASSIAKLDTCNPNFLRGGTVPFILCTTSTVRLIVKHFTTSNYIVSFHRVIELIQTLTSEGAFTLPTSTLVVALFNPQQVLTFEGAQAAPNHSQ
jgi:hypothetical protein